MHSGSILKARLPTMMATRDRRGAWLAGLAAIAAPISEREVIVARVPLRPRRGLNGSKALPEENLSGSVTSDMAGTIDRLETRLMSEDK